MNEDVVRKSVAWSILVAALMVFAMILFKAGVLVDFILTVVVFLIIIGAGSAIIWAISEVFDLD